MYLKNHILPSIVNNNMTARSAYRMGALLQGLLIPRASRTGRGRGLRARGRAVHPCAYHHNKPPMRARYGRIFALMRACGLRAGARGHTPPQCSKRGEGEAKTRQLRKYSPKIGFVISGLRVFSQTFLYSPVLPPCTD